MNAKKFDSEAEAKLRFPAKVFYWYDKRIGPFETAVECATEYAKAFKIGESYLPPTGASSVKAEYGTDRPVGQVPSLHLSAKQGKCTTCVDSQYPCPTCYTVWWNRKYPKTKVEFMESAELPKMPSELLLLAEDPLMGKALGRWILLVQDHHKQSLLEARRYALRNAAARFRAMEDEPNAAYVENLASEI